MPDHTGPASFNALYNRKHFLRIFILTKVQLQAPTMSSNNKTINMIPQNVYRYLRGGAKQRRKCAMGLIRTVRRTYGY